MKLGIDRLLSDPKLRQSLQGKRVAVLATPASVTSEFQSTLDALSACPDIHLTAAFGPQHGIRGDKQDNMVETQNDFDERLGIPVFSLYGEVRRPTPAMLDTFDVLLFDVQDVGCRIYTFITTLFYCLEDCSAAEKSLWVLDRPNPAGREVEGLSLLTGQESFVGAAPIPMRHGLTLGEAAQWYIDFKELDIDLQVIHMEGYAMHHPNEFGWPAHHLSWINPSPNLSTLNSTRVYPGSVILEGTTLSEGRGTTRALEQMGAPDLDIKAILNTMRELSPQWMQGCRIREVWFEPTFHKHHGKLCAGVQLHTDYADYKPEYFKPFRWVILFLKSIRLCYPDYPIWRDFPYEYEENRLAIDVINGGSYLREWVDDAESTIDMMEQRLLSDEQAWYEQMQVYQCYS